MTGDWRRVHEHVVTAFAAGWDRLSPRAFDALLADDVRLVQPLLPTCTDKQSWWGEVERLSDLLPDLRSDVLRWSGEGPVVFIEHRFTATVGRRTVSVPAVDRLTITESGVITHRTAYFDPAPLTLAVLRHPPAWWRWWRSGLGPLLGRRRLLDR
ncbi:nuclear transport factor 2 family protein [Nocardia wallacei]|uniref:SnoaL-like domain-containing protein n=1 Tax=Nocardia wallacei TaxID=480035 RepID=A0A7G1KL87_9NOCA|nr:nuclear transport factor 2 family protein [Nocardia wallacei]BCK55326.1 hypothetical protein NWFMUON74_30980 [Nocardia wallacei]